MKYKIHEVAALFPLLIKGSPQYNDLEESIRLSGQLDPIVVDNDVLLDGRNRLAICEDNGIEPRTVQWSTLGIRKPQHEWIFAKNAARRNLTEDQRAAVYTAYNAWIMMDDSRLRKEATQFKAGNEGGPGRGKTVTHALCVTVSEPKRDCKKERANSTAGQIAKAADVPVRKAETVLALYKEGQSGNQESAKAFEEIKLGIQTVKQLRKKSLKPKPIKSLTKRMTKAWDSFWKKFTPEEKPEVFKWISEQL
jgi:hypothetical protein